MQRESLEQPAQVMPPRENANEEQNRDTAEPLGVRLVAIDAGRKMAEMEQLFRSAGNHTGQMEALATLRRWQFDPRLDPASQQRARALVWKFQPNGWVEI